MPTGFTTVSAAHLQDSTGTAISNATISFLPVLNGAPTSFKAGGTAGQTIDTAVTAQVTSGAFSIQLADTSLTNPVNVGYRVTVTDNVSGKVLLAKGYECIQPTGSTWSFDAFVPNLAAQAPYTQGPAGTIAIAGATSLSSGATPTVTNVGTATAAELQFGIPAGPVGSQGPQGPNGPSGTLTSNTGITVGGSLLAPTSGDLPFTKAYSNVVIAISPFGRPCIIRCTMPDGTQFGITPPASQPDFSALGVGTRGQVTGKIGGDNRFLAGTAFTEAGVDGSQFPITTTAQSMGITPTPVYEQPCGTFLQSALAKTLHHYIIYGESTGAAADSYTTTGPNPFNPITTSQPFSNVRFSSDPVTTGGLGVTDISGITLQPLTPYTSTTGSPPPYTGVETCANGFADRLASLVAAHDLPYKVLVSNAAVSGQTYSTLRKGASSGYYNELMAQVSQGMALAAANSLTYELAGIILFLGYNDADAGQTWEQYAANLVTLQANIQSDYQALMAAASTPTAKNVPMLMWQCAYNTGLGTAWAARTYPQLFGIFGTAWQCQGSVAFGNAGANGLHLSPYDQRLMGEFAANLAVDMILQGRFYPDIYPASVQVQGRKIVLNYIGNFGPLQNDTAFVTDPLFLGFRYVDAARSNLVSATITGPSQVTLMLDRYAALGTAQLSYAYSFYNLLAYPGSGNPGWGGSARGRIFDSRQGTSYYPDQNGNHTPMCRPATMWLTNF